MTMKASFPSRLPVFFRLAAFFFLTGSCWHAFFVNQYAALPNSWNVITTKNRSENDDDDVRAANPANHEKGVVNLSEQSDFLETAKAELLKSVKAELLETAKAELLESMKIELLETTKAELLEIAKAQLLETEQAKRSSAWYPQYYSTNLTRLLNRGTNLITADSGCMMASWVVTSGDPSNAWDCNRISHPDQWIEGKEHLVQPYDTIYVPVVIIGHFTEQIMPKINVPVVIIAGQWWRIKTNLDDDWERNFLPLYSNPNVLKIFCQNAIKYAHQDDPKLEPFPYGFQRIPYDSKARPPVDIYRDAFLKHLELPEKTTDVLVGFLDVRTNPLRENMPNAPWMDHPVFYDRIAQSKFVLSPNGERPDCYRHYEAIGLGAIPITELDPYYYRHLKDAPILYNTTIWTLDGATALQMMGLKEFPVVNRNMVFEEYWMEYVERILEYPLRWWDRVQKQKSLLTAFDNTIPM